MAVIIIEWLANLVFVCGVMFWFAFALDAGRKQRINVRFLKAGILCVCGSSLIIISLQIAAPNLLFGASDSVKTPPDASMATAVWNFILLAVTTYLLLKVAAALQHPELHGRFWRNVVWCADRVQMFASLQANKDWPEVIGGGSAKSDR